MRFRGGYKGGLMCPEGIIALIEEMSEDFIPLSPPSEGTVRRWLPTGRKRAFIWEQNWPAPDLGLLGFQKELWAVPVLLVLAAAGWLRQTWCLLISLIMGFVLSFHLGQWSTLYHSLPMTDPPTSSRAFPQSASCCLKLSTGIQGAIILEEISVTQTKST